MAITEMKMLEHEEWERLTAEAARARDLHAALFDVLRALHAHEQLGGAVAYRGAALTEMRNAAEKLPAARRHAESLLK